jgi:hypothetical protein
MTILYGCASVPLDEYQGNLDSGKIYSGSLHSSDVWLFYGEKGSRVVISDAANNGAAPPLIYLYPPDGRWYEACAEGECGRYRTLEHELDVTGEYTVLIRPSGPGGEGDYRLAFARFPLDCPYEIEPDDFAGTMIKSDCIIPEKTGLVWYLTGIAGAYVVTPFTVLPSLLTIYSGIGAMEGALNPTHRELAKELELPEKGTDRIAVMAEPMEAAEFH